MTQYAKGTEVSVAKSRAEIEILVTKYGATAFGSAWQQDKAIIQFEADGRRIRFVLPLPSQNDPKYLKDGRGATPGQGSSRVAFDEALEAQITTPHRHEDAHCPPLWLIWVNRNDGDGWALHCVGNSEETTRYSIECSGNERAIIVERIPANHVFASSIESELREENHRIAVKSYSQIHGYRRQGD